MHSGRKVWAVLGAAAAAVALCASSAICCESCLLSQSLAPVEGVKGHGIKITERLSLLDRVYHGSAEVSGAGAREAHQTTEVLGYASPLPCLTLVALLPYRHARTRGDLLLEGDGSVAGLDPEGAGSSEGVGDFSLLARYTILSSRSPAGSGRIEAIAGVKLPTGSTNARTDNGVRYLDGHLQPGTGSTDYLVGVSLSRVRDRFSFSANVLGTLTNDGEFGDTRHRFGNSVYYDVTARYRVLPGAPAPRAAQVFAVLGISGESSAKERHDGVIQDNTGGRILFVAPGLQVALGPHWVFDFSYQAAVDRDLAGTQLGETSKLVGAVSYQF